MRIVVVGAGLTGLTAALRLSQKGHQITIFEKESLPGGLATGFKPASPQGGQKGWDWSLEYFFHHLFTSDDATQKLIVELGLTDKLFFTRPKTSIFYKNTIAQFDSPFSLFTFPHLNFPEKMRTGLVTLHLKTTRNWKPFENITAFEWLKKYYGEKTFAILWKPLLLAKFGDQARNISMAWFWARVKKRSPKLGYLQGGFQVLINKLVEKIKENGGKILFNQEINQFNQLNQKKFDRIIFTVPNNIFLEIMPNLSRKYKTQLQSSKMIGAINLILVLKEKFLADNTYWLNINEPNFPFVAVVEHTNFVNPQYYDGNHILYIGGYYPPNHRYFKMTKEQIFEEFLPFLQKINPQFNMLHVTCYMLHVNQYAQPIIPMNYSRLIPSHKTPIPNVYLANMQQIYPWDRGTNYAIELGEKIAHEIENS